MILEIGARPLDFMTPRQVFSFFSIPILVAFGLRLFSWRILLLILGAASLLLPIYFWKVSIEPKQETSQQRIPIVDLFKRRTVWIMGILWIFASGSCIGVYSILPLYLIKERGIDFHLPTLYLESPVWAVSLSPSSLVFYSDRYGYRTMLMLSLCTTGLSTIGLSLVFHPAPDSDHPHPSSHTFPYVLSSRSGHHLKVNSSFGTLDGHRSDRLHWDDFWNGIYPFPSGHHCRPSKLPGRDLMAGDLDNLLFFRRETFRKDIKKISEYSMGDQDQSDLLIPEGVSSKRHLARSSKERMKS